MCSYMYIYVYSGQGKVFEASTLLRGRYAFRVCGIPSSRHRQMLSHARTGLARRKGSVMSFGLFQFPLNAMLCYFPFACSCRIAVEICDAVRARLVNSMLQTEPPFLGILLVHSTLRLFVSNRLEEMRGVVALYNW